MLRAELQKISGRRTLFLLSAYGPAAICLVIALIMVVLYEVRPNPDSIGGDKALGWFGVTSVIGTLAFITLAAQEGAWDTANGTMRYLLLTGATRRQLYTTRIAALLAIVTFAVLLVVGISLTFALLAPTEPGDDLTLTDALKFAGMMLLYLGFWSVLTHGIGSLTGSNGAATTFAFVAFFGAQIIGPLVSHFSKEIQYLFPTEAIGRVLGDSGSGSPLWLAIVVLVAWFVGAIWMGYARLKATEY
jgi:ABC-type transport system involved in multi-copper enzyme maturation permease subunit